jgi:hypothetical protein
MFKYFFNGKEREGKKEKGKGKGERKWERAKEREERKGKLWEEQRKKSFCTT